MKGLLFFFDGLTLSLPEDLARQVMFENAQLIEPLRERGLITNISPAVLDAETRIQLADAVGEAIQRMRQVALLGDSPPDEQRFGDLAIPHFGDVYYKRQDEGVAVTLAEMMISCGLARRPGWVNSFEVIRMDPALRAIVLHLYGQALQLSQIRTESRQRVELVGQGGMAARYLCQTLRQKGITVAKDLPAKVESQILSELGEPFSISKASLDEIIDFRKQYGRDMRAYMNSLRSFTQQANESDDPARLLAERKQEIKDYEATLRRKTGVGVARAATVFTFGAVGSIWTTVHGDAWGALFALLAAAAGIQIGDHRKEVTTFSHIAHVHRKFS